MANSRTLLVYVLALVVCSGCGGSFWVSANTVPLLKEPVVSTGASPPSLQYQRYQQQQQHHHVQQNQLTAQHQQIQETSRTSPSPSSSSSPAVLAPKMLQHQATDNSNNAPSAISIKNAWGLSAGNSDSGPYMAGHSYISGRALPESFNPPKSDYDLVRLDDRASRQVSQSLFAGFTPALQDFFTNGISMKSILLGGLMTYGVQNFGIPESINQLIPMFRYFRSQSAEAPVIKKEKEVPAPTKELSEKKAPLPVKEVSEKKAPETVKEAPAKMEEVVEELTEVAEKTEEVPAPVMMMMKEDPIKKESDAPAVRTKRDVPQADNFATELAALVLSAIKSGECMQKTICILGTKIGASNKGRTAFLLMDKLISESVQEHEYFVTLKKALRSGEGYCEKFRCKSN